MKAKPKQKSPLKLFVWTQFNPDYTSGLAVAIARTETEARKLVIKDYGYEPHDWGILNIRPLSKKFAVSVCGGG